MSQIDTNLYSYLKLEPHKHTYKKCKAEWPIKNILKTYNNLLYKKPLKILLNSKVIHEHKGIWNHFMFNKVEKRGYLAVPSIFKIWNQNFKE